MKKLYSLILLHLVLLISYNANAQGSWQWGVTNVSYAGSPSAIEAYATTTDNSGNIFIAGDFLRRPVTIGSHTITGSGLGMLLVKMDSSGNVIYAVASSVGGSMLGVTTDSAGNLYAMGQYTSGSCSFGSVTISTTASIMNFIVKVSPVGDVIWARNVAGYHTSAHISGGLMMSPTNALYVSGSFNLDTVNIGSSMLINHSHDSADIFIAKYDTAGNPQWAKSFGGHNADNVYDVAVSPGGDIFVGGRFESESMIIGTDTLVDSFYGYVGAFPKTTSFIARFDSSGNPVWAKALHTYINLWDIQTDAAKNVYVNGQLDSTITYSGRSMEVPWGADPFVAKFDSSGTLMWANAAYAIRGAGAYSCAVDSCGNVWQAGVAYGQILFDSVLVDTPAIGVDRMFIAAYDHCGKYIPGTGQILGSGGDDLMQITLDRFGNLFLGGDYTRISMIFGPDTLPIPAPFDECLLLAKYRIGPMPCDTMPCHLITEYTHALTMSPDISLYPNPATNECTITTNTPVPANTKAELYDVTGRIIHTYTLSGNKTTISTTDLLPGLYTCRITADAHNTIVKKLVIVR